MYAFWLFINTTTAFWGALSTLIHFSLKTHIFSQFWPWRAFLLFYGLPGENHKSDSLRYNF